MSVIRAENLTFAYPASYDNIFEDVNFQIDTDWKLGLIGRNGRGKTTLLRLLSGGYEYQGRIQASVRFDYFPYPAQDADRSAQEVLRQVCPAAQEWELLRELSCLEVGQEVLYRPFSRLSNGEQTKVLLAALFLNEGHFLLIDEPTNHLDTKGRETVSAYLKRKKGFILVSHDRSFLDGCVDHILSINRAGIQVQSGNFSCWFEDFQRRQKSELARNEKLKKDIGHMRRAAQRTAGWADRIEASKYGDGGDRILLEGKNGAGKTSLLKLLMGQAGYQGRVIVGSGLVLSYLPQDTSALRGSLSEFARDNRIDESLFKAILRKLDFSRTQFEKRMEDFSAGQKKKVLLAKSLCEPAHLYVWDEPLNYIDIYSRMQIEELIRAFSPTMIFVEHDQAFQNAVATKRVRIGGW